MKYTLTLSPQEIKAHELINATKKDSPLQKLMIQVVDAPEHLLSDDDKIAILYGLRAEQVHADTFDLVVKKLLEVANKLNALED